jgi:hypothetical protein
MNLLELVRQAQAAQQGKLYDFRNITDDQRVRALCTLIAAARHGDPSALSRVKEIVTRFPELGAIEIEATPISYWPLTAIPT